MNDTNSKLNASSAPSKTRNLLSKTLITIGVAAWVPYMIANYLLGYDWNMTPFLIVHLLGIIPGSILKRWPK